MSNTLDPIGWDEFAYLQREKGYSPEPIRDAVWEIVKNDLNGIVLDAGMGSGGWTQRLITKDTIDRVIGVDLVDCEASKIDNLEFHLGDLSYGQLPCETCEIDWIFALEIMEHLSNPRHFIKESYRCLKNEGKLFLSTPCNDSIRAKLFFLFKGYFPAFCDHDYKSAGHITPMLEFDLKRMAIEAGFRDIEFFYPLSGRIPKTKIEWKKLLPSAKGKLYSDTLFALLTK